MRLFDRRSSRLFTAATLIALMVCGLAPSHAVGSRNQYRIVGLAPYVTAPTPFTVEVSGPDPVCGMQLSSGRDTSAPWQLIFEPTEWGQYLRIELCNGFLDLVEIDSQLAWRVSYQPQQRSTKSWPSGPVQVSVMNYLDKPVSATIFSPNGVVLFQNQLPPKLESKLSFESSDSNFIARYRIQVMAPQSGLESSQELIVTNKWAVSERSLGAENYKPCSTIYWSYDPSLAPPKVDHSLVLKDIREALALISQVTRLKYVELPDPGQLPEDNWLLVNWDFRSLSFGTLAMGGPRWSGGSDSNGRYSFHGGEISINPAASLMTSSKFRGSGWVKSGLTKAPGRTWVFVHEALHTLGMGHANSTDQIMFHTIKRIGFGSGDLVGMRYLYAPETCSG